MSKQMLIVTGPQGSGNHLWSKIFSLHKDVYGWKSLLKNYWEPHRFNEPFADYWKHPKKLKDFDWTQSEYYFTSISVPLGIPGNLENPLWEPKLLEFTYEVSKHVDNIEWAVLGRDQNILREQQTRVRSEPTLPMFMEQLELEVPHHFLSYELLYLYKQDYLRSLNEHIKIPIDYDNKLIDKILEDDANAKYVHGVVKNELDTGNRTGKIFKDKP